MSRTPVSGAEQRSAILVEGHARPHPCERGRTEGSRPPDRGRGGGVPLPVLRRLLRHRLELLETLRDPLVRPRPLTVDRQDGIERVREGRARGIADGHHQGRDRTARAVKHLPYRKRDTNSRRARNSRPPTWERSGSRRSRRQGRDQPTPRSQPPPEAPRHLHPTRSLGSKVRRYEPQQPRSQITWRCYRRVSPGSIQDVRAGQATRPLSRTSSTTDKSPTAVRPRNG